MYLDLYVCRLFYNAQVNPYEFENVADTLNRALEMPLDERQLRMNQLKKREKRMDVDSWVKTFLQTMGAIYNDMVIKTLIHSRYIHGHGSYSN